MVGMAEARRVVLVISADRGLRESLEKVVARAKCRAVAVHDCAAADRIIVHDPPVLILIDPTQRQSLSASARAVCVVVEIPVRTSQTGVRRLARPGSEAVRWLTGLVAQRCAASS